MPKELAKVMTDKVELQKDYTIVVQEKDEAKKKVEMILKEKEEVEQQVERIYRSIQKLYKVILEVTMVVDATLEEHVSKISEFIQGFHTRIREFKVHTIPGTPPEEKEERERKTITSVEKIKSLDEECMKL